MMPRLLAWYMAMFFLLMLVIVFLVSFLLTGLWLKLALQNHWFDHPNFRSAHAVPVPKCGGFGFVLAFTGYAAWLGWQHLIDIETLLSVLSGLLLAVTGLADDFSDLSIRARLGVQLVGVISVLYLLSPAPVLSLPGLTLQPGFWLLPLLLLAMLWFINLFNFMDGIDALAATEAIFICLALALFCGATGDRNLVQLTLGLAAAVTAFLFFNLPVARLFMGDLGSNYLGLVLGVLALLALEAGSVNIWTLLILPGVFLIDSSYTLLVRMGEGVVWYHGHNSHAYQRAASILDSHAKVVIGMLLINVFWILPFSWATLFLEQAGFVLVMIAWAPLLFLVRYYRKC